MQDRDTIARHLRLHTANVHLVQCAGRLQNVAAFAEQHAHCLAPHEARIIRSNLSRLPRRTPGEIPFPLRRVDKLPSERLDAFPATRSGGRSAYWPGEHLHFKGCNPAAGLTFPLERLPFGASEIVHDKIPFGCLSAENVCREILAWLFWAELGQGEVQQPLCVMEYEHEGAPIGYCLVIHRAENRRGEDLLEYHGLTIRDLIQVKMMERQFRLRVLAGDAGYHGVDSAAFLRHKAALLASMNIRGGFRGVLNSNLGNDLVLPTGLPALCDFDTFQILDIPPRPSESFLRPFGVWCLAELLKTSTMVWDYIDLEDASSDEAAALLWASFSRHSSLWKAYKAEMVRQASGRGWDVEGLVDCLEMASQAPACASLLLDVVPNSTVLTHSYPPELSLYVGHN